MDPEWSKRKRKTKIVYLPPTIDLPMSQHRRDYSRNIEEHKRRSETKEILAKETKSNLMNQDGHAWKKKKKKKRGAVG